MFEAAWVPIVSSILVVGVFGWFFRSKGRTPTPLQLLLCVPAIFILTALIRVVWNALCR